MLKSKIFHTSVRLDNFTLKLQGRKKITGLEALKYRTGHLMISLKNRRFDTQLIDLFCRVSSEHMNSGYITVVDAPYIHNVDAITSDPQERKRKVAGVTRLSADRTTQVKKVLKRYPDNRICLLPWCDLVSRVPDWITEEVASAYQRTGRFGRKLSRHCRAMLPAFDSANDPMAFERFLVEEIPPLLYAYYLLDGGVVDFYPGPLPSFVWDIDLGQLASELPRVSELAKRHAGVSYVEVAKDS